MPPLTKEQICLTLSRVFLATLPLSTGCMTLYAPNGISQFPHQGVVESGPLGAVHVEADLPVAENFDVVSHVPQSGIEQIHQKLSGVVECLQGERLHVEPFDEHFNEHVVPEEPEAPEIPWPRFHPVPTRPLLGG